MLDENFLGGNCYTDSSEGRLLAHKSFITFEGPGSGTPDDANSFKTKCISSCKDGSYSYAGIQLIDGTKTLECWCGHTQPLK